MPSSVASSQKYDKNLDENHVVLADNVSLDSEHRNVGGAPVEDDSPLGKDDVGWWTAVFLNFSQMIGTGIFSTPGTILRQTGSFGLAMFFWVFGFLLSAAGLAYFTEFLALFPNRAGSEVAYLEQGFKRPKFLFPVSFAVITIILGFASSNALVCGEYVLYSRGIPAPSATHPWEMRGIAVAAYGIACIIVVAHNRTAMWFSNVFSAVKVGILLFIVVTGWAVLGGSTRVENPHANFTNSFDGSSNDANGIALALINVLFAYQGWNNVNNVANEMRNPLRTVKTAGPTALGIVFFLYIFANIAYISAVPVEEAKQSGQLLAAKFFTAVFGDYAGTRVLPVFVVISAFGNLISVAIGQARVFREVARQGIFPFARFFSSTKPFGTPAAPMLLKFILTSIIIIGPPAGDAFQLIVGIQSYPNRLFDFLIVIGLFLIRRRRSKAGLPRPEFKAWDVALYISVLANILLLVMPWVPPTGSQPYKSFPYYVPWVTGLGILFICFGYWGIWALVLPRVFGYKIYEEVVQLSKRELSKRFVHVYHDSRGDAYRARLREEASRPQPGEEVDPIDEKKEVHDGSVRV